MESWIRYSVAVYVGLLLAGTAMIPRQLNPGSSVAAYPSPQHQTHLNQQFREHHPPGVTNTNAADDDTSTFLEGPK